MVPFDADDAHGTVDPRPSGPRQPTPAAHRRTGRTARAAGDAPATTTEPAADAERPAERRVARRSRHEAASRPQDPGEERTGTMTVVEHLEELRHRIVVCLWAIGIAAIVAWFLYAPFLT